jgi:hypothetical protein
MITYGGVEVYLPPWPLYPPEKSPWYALNRRLGGPQSQSGCCRDEKSDVNYRSENMKEY